VAAAAAAAAPQQSPRQDGARALFAAAGGSDAEVPTVPEERAEEEQAVEAETDDEEDAQQQAGPQGAVRTPETRNLAPGGHIPEDFEQQDEDEEDIHLTPQELRELLQQASERGARKALKQRVMEAQPTCSSTQQFDPRRAPKSLEQLQYGEAGHAGALEDWLFELERALDMQRISDDAERIRVAGFYWDRSMQRWCDGVRKLRSTKGTPLTTWKQLCDVLRRTFLDTGEAEAAFSKLLVVRQKGDEKMDAYVRRVDELRTQAGEYADEEGAVVHACVGGVDKDRWPMTLQAVRRRMGAARDSGQPLSFEELRQLLAQEAHYEPSGRVASHNGGAGVDKNTTRARRIAVLQAQLEQLQSKATNDGGGGDDEVRVAPVGKGDTPGTHGGKGSGSSDGRCWKCGEEGHRVWECTSKKELRVCGNCKKKGHLRRDCTAAKQEQDSSTQPGAAAAAAAAASQSKNE